MEAADGEILAADSKVELSNNNLSQPHSDVKKGTMSRDKGTVLLSHV